MIQYELTQNQFFDFNSNNNQLGIDLAVTKFSDIIFKAAKDFSNQWRHTNIVSIPKPNKSKFDIKNYGPISLISKLSKLIKKASAIVYGAIIYNSTTRKKSQYPGLIHNQGMHLATGAFRTIPVDSIRFYSDDLPLYYRC
ncbi:RNA-directed DNA polymerase from mobile element jockey [Aphis craccivora]|uniref:RNA-directed DNA polymerase from mobile element jockey n=1 Tax=Aphis craccivora TaxID=307492 RepID=A0A6G0ZJW0_APHCR|nr:RNA-directed DNA polymerase from mobile element jockey [Aphis craccivora]